MKKSVIALLLATAAWVPLTAQGVVIFSENFNDGTVDAAITGSAALAVDTAPSGQQFLGLNDGTNNTDPSNRGLANNTVTLSLFGLAAHTTATLSFTLYVINSMDGDEPFSVAETAAGTILAAFCKNTPPQQCDLTTGPPPDPRLPGATNSLGFAPINTGTVGDTTYDFTLSFAHSAASLSATFSYTGQQGITDESWGLDNISVDINSNGTTPPPTGAPEPGSLALLGSALAGLWITRRRTRRS